MNIELIDRPPVKVTYLRYQGPYGEPLSNFWSQAVYPWLLAKGLLGKACYGICYDDPNLTAPEQCRYDACVAVPDDFVPSDDELMTIPGGRYAVMSFNGTVHEIGAAWTYLLRDWLASNGFRLDSRPCFEHYPPNPTTYDPDTGVFNCEICIPVLPV